MSTIKKLQPTFTTHEQSRQLMALGLPADSADLFYMTVYGGATTLKSKPEVIDTWARFSTYDMGRAGYLPCWSFGQLMEIYRLCTGHHWQDRDGELNRIEQLIHDFACDIQPRDYLNLEE